MFVKAIWCVKRCEERQEILGGAREFMVHGIDTRNRETWIFHEPNM